MANSFYDVLETRSADGREAALLAALPEAYARAKQAGMAGHMSSIRTAGTAR